LQSTSSVSGIIEQRLVVGSLTQHRQADHSGPRRNKMCCVWTDTDTAPFEKQSSGAHID
jgi:hypothetical protein